MGRSTHEEVTAWSGPVISQHDIKAQVDVFPDPRSDAEAQGQPGHAVDLGEFPRIDPEFPDHPEPARLAPRYHRYLLRRSHSLQLEYPYDGRLQRVSGPAHDVHQAVDLEADGGVGGGL